MEKKKLELTKKIKEERDIEDMKRRIPNFEINPKFRIQYRKQDKY